MFFFLFSTLQFWFFLSFKIFYQNFRRHLWTPVQPCDSELRHKTFTFPQFISQNPTNLRQYYSLLTDDLSELAEAANKYAKIVFQ